MAIIKTNKSVAQLREELGKYAIIYDRKGTIVMRSHQNYNSKKFKKLRIANGKQLKEAHRLARLILAEPGKRAEYEAKCVRPNQNFKSVLLGELLKNLKKISYGYN
jgi:hypothetical protein